MIIQRRIHQQYIVLPPGCRLDVGILAFGINGIEINSGSVFISLKIFYPGLIFFQCKMFFGRIGQQNKILGLFIKFFFADGAIFFVVAFVGPLWGIFFLEYYSLLLTPIWGSAIILVALLLFLKITVQQAKKADMKQAQP